jgi:hypothetical protein
MKNIRPFVLGITVLFVCASATAEGAFGAATPPSGCMKTTDFAVSIEKPVPDADSIQVQSITPAAGTTVQKSTVLVVDLACTLKSLGSGKYAVVAQFDTTKQGRSTDGNFNNYTYLTRASGTFRLCFPIADIWSFPDVTMPLSVRFFLNKWDDSRHSHPVAISEKISFNAG